MIRDANVTLVQPRPYGARAGETRPERVFRGKILELGGNRPFLLDGRRVLLVQRGEVDVFSVARIGTVPVGARRHLCRVGTGGLLLGLGPEVAAIERGLLAVPTNGTLLEVGSEDELSSLLHAGGATSERASALIEAWIEALAQGLPAAATPAGCRDLELGNDAQVVEAAVLCSREVLCWVQPLDGQAYLQGEAGLELPAGIYTPLPRQAFVAVPETALLSVQPTSRLHDLTALFGGLAGFEKLVLASLTRAVAADRAEDEARARATAAATEAVLAGACARLAGALRPKVLLPDDGGAQDTIVDAVLPRQANLTFAACRLVAAAAGITLKRPAGLEALASFGDPLSNILQRCRVRSRRVALRGDWWRHDHGPLLGYLADDEGDPTTPVALLRDGEGYRLHEPTGDAPACRLDAATAARLAPFAYTFYRSFTDAPIGLWPMLRFGMRGSNRDFAMMLAMGAASALLALVPAMATSRLFNDILPGAERSQLTQMIVLLAAAALGSSGFGIARGIALLRVRGRSAPSIQAALWDRLLRLPLTFFRKYSAGDLAVRVSAVDAIEQVLSGSVLGALMSGGFALFDFALMFHYSPAMAPRGVLLIAAAVTVTVVGGLLQLRPQRGLVTLQSRVSGLVLQLLSSIGKLRVAGAEVRAFAKWASLFAKERRLQFTVRFIGNWVHAIGAAFPLLASAVMYWTVLPLLTEGEALPRTGDVLAYLAAFNACLGGVLGTCSALLTALTAWPLYQQAKPILQALPEVAAGRSAPGLLSGEIEIQHATFRYQSDAPLVLRDVSLRIKPGEFVAFVGASGSGKSTLLKLLLGFETLETGGIYYDGQEIGGIDIQEVRRQMGVVIQNGQLLAGDIFTNIIGSNLATLDEAWAAARMVGLADDIEKMPMGMHTLINDGASTLSGGQRQRLLLARAIVNGPKILLLDEATSALDNRNQAIVSESLARLRATRVIVAHRLSTIVNADRIYVLERGRIVQSGTYAALMADEGGAFAQLASRQVF